MASAITRRAATRRIQLLVLLVVGMFAVLALRATWLGTVRASWLSARAETQQKMTITEPAERGRIISADGQTFAIDKPTMEITADGRYVGDPLKATDTLLSILGGTPKLRERILADLAAKKPYVVIAHNARIVDAEKLRQRKLPGVTFRRNTLRDYPQGTVAGQVIGFTSLENGRGVEGIEARLDKHLTGTDGKRVEVRDPRLGVTVRNDRLRSPVPGKGVRLTINASIQAAMEAELVRTRLEYGAVRATGVVMDPNTGDVLAMASVPRLNANNRAKLKVDATQVRAITDPYEPGSVFKVITVAGALEEGVTTPTTKYDLPPSIPVPADPKPIQITDAKKRDHWQEMTTTEILQQSSNIGTIYISRELKTKKRLRYWMDRFGFGHRTGIDLNNESAGTLPALPWNVGQESNIPFGHGVETTTLQQARAYAAIANGGMLVTPRIIASIDGRPTTAPAPRRIISKRTSSQLTTMMETVVEGSDGTGIEAHINNYRVAGKTGTAEKVENGRYVSKYRASFVGFVPANKPRLVIAVMIDEPDPEGPHTGGLVAAPTFQKIGDKALSTLSIPPN